MGGPHWYYWCALAWAAVGLITFVYLFFQTAPYGRHTTSGWGPLISNRLGWMIMEGLSPVFISVWFWAGNTRKSDVDYLLYCLYTGHYIYRGYVYPFLTRTSGKKMPISITLSAVFFNSVNTFFIGYFLGFLGGRPEISAVELSIGLILFTGGFIIHVISDQILIRLRKPGETGYKIPRGFLFRFVVSPNYLGEVIQWTGFAVLAGSAAGWLFVLWTLANLMPRARAHLKWYREKFPEFPADRKALFPGLF